MELESQSASPFPILKTKSQRNESDDLAAELRKRIRGEVRFDAGSRALYAADLSNYRQVPIGVVVPRDAQDVIDTVAACSQRGVPILGRGCGTSLSGQCCNVAVVLDFSKYMNRLLQVDAEHKRAVVGPGVINDQLRDAAKRYQLTFAPDPATHAYCTMGGMIGNNSCGAHSVMGGKTVDNVEELDILTYDGLRMRVGKTSEAEFESIVRAGGRRGEIYTGLRKLRDRYAQQIRSRYPQIPRRVSGYNLDDLLPENGFHVARALVGSESTCALVLSATVRLMHDPPKRALLVIGYPDIFSAADAAPEIRGYGVIALEAFQKHVLKNMERKGRAPEGEKLLPEADTWLLAEFGGETQAEASDRARAAMTKIGGRAMHLLEDAGEQKEVWHIRESGLGASRVPHVEDGWPGWEDAAVAPKELGAYLRGFYKILDKYGYKFTIYGHFGDGCVHCRVCFDMRTPEGVKRFRDFMTESADLVVRHGGSLSGEHGDGQSKGELLPKMYGPELMQAFRDFKSIWDPRWKMNPGKIIDANPLDADLRYGPDYQPIPVKTYFRYPDDQGRFAGGPERCYGVGKCRELGGEDVMCPSFMVTREEQHSTRGRAHLLFEMMRGEVLTDLWRDEHVKEALDLCLACKGCKGDCPVSVDVATYKAEFLAHYWQGRLRPRSAYAFGLVDKWAVLASAAPGLVNLATQTPLLRELAKFSVGMPRARTVPAFAPQSFKHWFHHRKANNDSGNAQVLLWPDTFNNYFHPDVAQAAVEVLESAGFAVTVPRGHLCCGRPLYDFGMLDRAQSYLRRVLSALGPQLEAGTPIVVLEPSCASVFRDELHNLFPEDRLARRLQAQTFLLSEFLQRKATRWAPPKLGRKAIVQAHCHHKSVLKMEDEEAVLRKLGLDFQVLDSGCCGMAGSFGFEADKYDVSMACGERVLLPQVRKADAQTLILADGFSCQEQIAQATNRHALHLAQVIQLGLHPERMAGEGKYVESSFTRSRKEARRRSMRRTALALGAAAIAGALWWRRMRLRSPR